MAVHVRDAGMIAIRSLISDGLSSADPERSVDLAGWGGHEGLLTDT